MASTTSRCEAGAEGRDALAATEVRRLFEAVAPRYDLLNHVLSLGLDVLWRRSAVRLLPPGEGLRVADLCAGSGDLTASLARRLGPGGEVVGVDFCEPMIRRARRKYARLGGVGFLVADAMQLPLADDSFDAVTCGFGLRNLESPESAMNEMLRILRPGGRLVILDLCRPRGRPWRVIFGFYFRRLAPIVGRAVSGHAWAYSYLPASVGRFLGPEAVAQALRQAGAVAVSHRRLIGGVAFVVTGTRKTP